jgi:predicted metal-binding transcription factor (methanogenesis marker protein 9)
MFGKTCDGKLVPCVKKVKTSWRWKHHEQKIAISSYDQYTMHKKRRKISNR